MSIREAVSADVPAMLAIYAEYVTQTAVSFEYEVPSEAEFTRRLNDYASRTRDRTLTARNGLNAHFQRITELPFGCRKVTACGTRGKLCKASVNKHSAEHQSLADG